MSKFKAEVQDQNKNLAQTISAVKQVLAAGATTGVAPSEVADKLAMESAVLTTADVDVLRSGQEKVMKALIALESADVVGSREGVSTRGMTVAAEAGSVGALVATGLNKHVASQRAGLRTPVATEGAVLVNNYMGKTRSEPRVAFEYYDEAEIRNSVVSTTVLNYAAARQNAFAEMFFPTIVMSPDMVGYHMHLSQINVMKETLRDIAGSYKKAFDRINLVKAQIDHTILENNETNVIPVVRDENKALFVDETDVAPHDVTINGVTFKTAPLKMGIDADLLGLSQNEALLRAGIMDQTDALDPCIRLSALYLKVGTDVIKLDNLTYLTSANFVPALQGDAKDMILAFNAQSLPMTKETKTAAGADLGGELAKIKTNEWVVRLKLNVTGNANVQVGNVAINAGVLTVSEITDKDKNPVDITSGEGKAVADAIKAGSLIGCDLKAFRTNSNKRTRGLLLDMSSYSILYAVPLLGPISTNHPIARGDDHSQSDLAALITACRTFTTNRAVTTLFDIKDLLASYAKEQVMGSDFDSEYLGISRKLIQPYFDSRKLDVKKVVASLKSEDRPLQVQAAIVNLIRDMVFRAYYQSGMQPAADSVFAGEAPTPIVKIGCDPVIARYLQVQGDLRTIGGKFDVQIEASWDARMQNQVFIAFGYQTSEGESTYHPLNFGMMLWKPEVVIVAPIYRNGATNNELTVQPSFLHVCNTPMLMHIEIENVQEAAVDVVAINTRTVTD